MENIKTTPYGISIMAQTPHEMALEKIAELRHHQQTHQTLQKTCELKKRFAASFLEVSEIIFRHDYKLENRGSEPRSTAANFCHHFSFEERVALEDGIRRHPIFKARMIIFFMCSNAVLLTAIAPSLTTFFLTGAISCISLYGALVGKFPIVRFFFARRKLVRHRGKKEIERTLGEMGSMNLSIQDLSKIESTPFDC